MKFFFLCSSNNDVNKPNNEYYYCPYCNYKTYSNKTFNSHIFTQKHIRSVKNKS